MATSRQTFGRQGAAILISFMATAAWIIEILRWTYHYGKVPGSYMPDWMAVTWIICLLGTPILSIILSLVIGLDRREKVTPDFTAAIAYGSSPILLFAYYVGVYL